MPDRRWFLAGGFGSLLSALPRPATAELTAKHGFNDHAIDWKLFDEGRKLALREDKPILFLAHTTWCPHCARYRKVFFDASVVSLIRSFVPVLVDGDLQSDVASQFAPDGNYIPRTLFLTPEAQLVEDLRYTDREFHYFVDYDHPSYLLEYLERARRQFS